MPCMHYSSLLPFQSIQVEAAQLSVAVQGLAGHFVLRFLFPKAYLKLESSITEEHRESNLGPSLESSVVFS